jgi:hypothetical protein
VIAVGALSNNTFSATFTVLKFYREGNANGPPRFSLGYGFKSADNGQFTVHNSNSPDSEPCTYMLLPTFFTQLQSPGLQFGW